MRIRGLVLALAGCVLLAGMPVMPSFAEKSVTRPAMIDETAKGEEDPLDALEQEKWYGSRNVKSMGTVALSVSDSVSGYQHDSRFYSGYTIRKGIDVSKYQESIDWGKVKADGVEFVFVRAGFRGYGESGSLNPDPKLASYLNGAASVGLPVGVYFFSQAITTAEAKEEANYVASLIQGYHISLPVVMDYEYVGTSGRLYNAHLSASAATEICKEFCSTIESKGYQAMLYANKNMLEYSLKASEISPYYKIWLANYVSKTEYKGDYTFWQFRSDGSVDGISGNVDMNFWYEKNATTYTVVFDGNGATKGKMKKAGNCKYGTAYRLTKNAYERKGYVFNGWNTKKNGSGKKYKDEAVIVNLTEEENGVVTLYAQWKKVKYSIDYKLKGGTNSKANPKSYDVETPKIKLAEPTRKGYTFDGWYTDWTYETEVTSIKKGTTGNLKLYAKWLVNSYSIVYRGNGSTSGEMEDQTDLKYGKTYTLRKNGFKKKGYRFVGWNTKADGSGTAFEPREKVTSLKYKDNATIKLYAQWEER